MTHDAATFIPLVAVNICAVLVALLVVRHTHADAITLGEIKYRLRSMQRVRLEFPKTGYLQSLRFRISGTVTVPFSFCSACPHRGLCAGVACAREGKA